MKLFALSMLLLLGFTYIYAQETNPRPYRVYMTQTVHKQLLENVEGYSDKLEVMENYIRDYGNTGNDRLDTIPIVFHVLYRPGSIHPELEHINAAVERLNHDFGNYEGPSSEVFQFDHLKSYVLTAQNALVSFCSPLAVEGGSTLTNPISFIECDLSEWPIGDDMKSSLTGGADPIDPSHYLNVWVCQLEGNAAGFAQMPFGPEATDGIVIDYDYMPGFVQDTGYPYAKARRLAT